MHLEYSRLNKSNDDLHMKNTFDGYGLGTQLFWRGLSGSDDLGWAGLCLVDAYKMTGRKEYLNCPKKFNGARGAI